MRQKLKRDYKFWINVVTLAALAFLVVVSWDQIDEAFQNFGRLNTWAIILMIPIQMVSYYAVARLYQDFFKSQGEKISTKEMYKISLELNFVNHVFPSGGVSGFSYLSLRMKTLGVSTAKSTLAQLLRFALTFLTFLVLLVVALLLLSIGQSTSPFIIMITSTIISLTIFGTGISVYIISKPSRIKAFVSWLPKALNKLFKLLRISKREIINITKVESTLEDLHEDYVLLMQNKEQLKSLFGWAFLINFAEVLTIYVVYVALGRLINPGALIIAYAVANFAGLVAVLPGGIGIYEGLMTATLASAGVPKALALSATVIYRVISILLFVPIGYYFYHQAVKKSGGKIKQKIEEVSHESTSSES